MKDNLVILGGGIAGLIWSYYHPESIIITDQIGGQFSSKFQLGPKYLHVDENTKKFFKDLGIKPPTKKIKIGFYYDGELHSENTEENRKKYFEKTRGSSSEPYRSVMSANKTEFDSYDIGVDELINILKDKIQSKVILERITEIDLFTHEIITESGKLKFGKLISTIPMNIFMFMANKPNIAKQYQSFPTTFILGDRRDCLIKDFQDFDYVYVSDEQYPFHRLTKTSKGIVFEYKGDDLPLLLSEKDRYVMKTGQLIHNDIKVNFQNVKFWGRYGCWNHGIKVNDLLKGIYEEIRLTL